jgi:hypothetical protein
MNAGPHRGTRPRDLRLVIPVSSIRRHHIRGNNQPPIRSRRPAYGRHQRSPHSATITSTSSFPRLVATLVALQSRTFAPCMLSLWVAIRNGTEAHRGVARSWFSGTLSARPLCASRPRALLRFRHSNRR